MRSAAAGAAVEFITVMNAVAVTARRENGLPKGFRSLENDYACHLSENPNPTHMYVCTHVRDTHLYKSAVFIIFFKLFFIPYSYIIASSVQVRQGESSLPRKRQSR